MSYDKLKSLVANVESHRNRNEIKVQAERLHKRKKPYCPDIRVSVASRKC